MDDPFKQPIYDPSKKDPENPSPEPPDPQSPDPYPMTPAGDDEPMIEMPIPGGDQPG